MNKKHITRAVALLSLSILLIGLFFSCNTDEDANTQSKRELCYPNIGKIHNQMLDSVFKDLREAKFNLTPTRSSSQSSLTFEQAFEIAQKSTYSNLKKIQDEIPGMVPDSIKIKEFMFDVIFKTRSTSNAWQLLTPSQQIFYLKFQNILNENGIKAFQIQRRLLELEHEIRNSSLTNEEADLLSYGISVAYYSSQYWEENIYKWTSLIGQPVKKEEVTRAEPGYYVTILFPKSSFPESRYPKGSAIIVPYAGDPHHYFELEDRGIDGYYTGTLMRCPGDLVFNPEICTCDFIWDVNAIVEVDAWGGIAGGITGAAAGSAVGGVGAIPGAVSGAVQGAVSTSIIAALEEIWDYFTN